MYGAVAISQSSGLAKIILHSKVKGMRRRDKHKKRREDNIEEWTGMDIVSTAIRQLLYTRLSGKGLL